MRSAKSVRRPRPERSSALSGAGSLPLALALAGALLAAGSPARAECSPRLVEDLRGAVLRIADYPSYGELRIALDLRAVPSARSLTAARLELRSASGEAGRSWDVPLRETLAPGGLRRVLPTGELAPGAHRVGLVVDAGEGCKGLAGPNVSFERRRFGWEGNALGTQPRVIPPFTPLAVRGREVAAVLRRHELGASGLFDRVSSEGESLLREPMRWEVAIDGQPAAVRAGELELERVADDRVDVRARLSFGPLSGALLGRFEIDGLYRVSLALEGPAEARVERFDLVIPLAAEHATLMNAVTDGVHHHTLGAVPRGEGRVWDARRVGRGELPPGFVPYLWLGDEERGLAWMTASGRDFWFASGLPMAELRRSAGRVELVIHFANRPAALGGPRRIEFALQATPVKPRPSDWRLWQLTCGAPPGAVSICPLVTGWYWGAPTAYGDVRPRAADYSFLERLAQLRRGKPLPPLAGDQWLARRRGPRELDFAMSQASLRWTAAALAKRPRAVVAYVNPRGVSSGPELSFYNDEWRPLPFGEREGDDDGQYSIVVLPVQSYADFALAGVDRLLATGAIDGIYIDNTYLAPSWDERHGSGWRDLAGQLQPGVDLFELRGYLRRAQTLVYERRGAWWNVAHATTTPLSAVQGWAGIFLDGEWRYGATDFQQRFARDLLRAGSLGAQLGAVPVLLPGIEDAQGARARELSRSLAGVTALHELRVLEEARGAPREFAERLRAFGYGDARCAVHRYWDRPARFAVSGASAEALVVVCGADALALIVSYGGAGRAELAFDAAALGLPARGTCSDPERSGRIETTDRGCALFLLRNEVRWIERRGARER